MITVRLQGGLGNQLFQYAAARTLAHHHSTSVAFDLRALQGTPPASDITPRNYELSAFGIEPIQPPLLDSLSYGLKATPLSKPLRSLLRRWHRPTEYRERTFEFDPDFIKSTSGRTYLTGYFQSERYFESIRDLLRFELKFVNSTESLPLPRNPHASLVSLHIRRGDYVTNPLHGLCSMEYYETATAYLAQLGGHIHLVVFSDDQPWARKHLQLPYPATFVEGNSGANSFRDMQLMSQCQHHVIANSSFSWWGAWLNPNPDKLVVAPKRWLADETETNWSAARTPTDWVRL